MQNYQREQDSPFSRLQLLADLSKPPQVKYNDLGWYDQYALWLRIIRSTSMCA